MEEEELDNSVETRNREDNKKLLREQDRTWEQGRIKELGTGAVMGPLSSPVKQRGEDEEQLEGAEMRLGGARKRRRKARKYKVFWRKDGESN